MNVHSACRLVFAFASIAVACFASAANAGLLRAYLSGNGNDANPCTLQQPCRLLPAALAAVNDGGEIWILDSANYNVGTVNITQSVSILAIPGAQGSVVANGGDGSYAISIFAPGSNVTLRNLNVLEGTPYGGDRGIHIDAVGVLSLDGIVVENLDVGLDLNGRAAISIKDSVFRSNTHGVIVIQNVFAQDSVSIDHSSFIENSTAITAVTFSSMGFLQVTIDNSVVVGGISAIGLVFGGGSPNAAPIAASIAHTKLAGGGAGGFGVGMQLMHPQTVVTLADCHVSGWHTGVNALDGVIRSLGNNFFVDNTVDTTVQPVPVTPL